MYFIFALTYHWTLNDVWFVLNCETPLTSHFSGCVTVLTSLARRSCLSQRGIIDRQKEESENMVWEMYFLGAAAPADSGAMRMTRTGSFDPLPEGNWSCHSLCYLFNLKPLLAEHSDGVAEDLLVSQCSLGFLYRFKTGWEKVKYTVNTQKGDIKDECYDDIKAKNLYKMSFLTGCRKQTWYSQSLKVSEFGQFIEVCTHEM